MQVADIQLTNTFNFVVLVAFTKPIITLNTSVLNSGEPLQISCSAVELDSTASILYHIQMDGATIASEKRSFVRTIHSVKSTEAGNYICKVLLTAVPDIARLSSGKILSGKSILLFISIITILSFQYDGNIDHEQAKKNANHLFR